MDDMTDISHFSNGQLSLIDISKKIVEEFEVEPLGNVYRNIKLDFEFWRAYKVWSLINAIHICKLTDRQKLASCSLSDRHCCQKYRNQPFWSGRRCQLDNPTLCIDPRSFSISCSRNCIRKKLLWEKTGEQQHQPSISRSIIIYRIPIIDLLMKPPFLKNKNTTCLVAVMTYRPLGKARDSFVPNLMGLSNVRRPAIYFQLFA